MRCLAFLSIVFAQTSLYGLRVGVTWSQFLNQTGDLPKSRSYWLGGPHIGALVHLPLSKRVAFQTELNAYQRTAEDRNLRTNYKYSFWSLELPLLLSWVHKTKLNIFFLETGPSVGVILGGRVQTQTNQDGTSVREKITFGKNPGADLRRGEISWAVGAAAGYPVGPGYLNLGMRFLHGINNLAGGDFQKWYNYSVWMTVSYLYDPSQKSN
ncbi:MAG: porin family protein [Bacteroidia bacterium]